MHKVNDIEIFKKQVLTIENNIKIISEDKLFTKGNVRVDFSFYSNNNFINTFIIDNYYELTENKRQNLLSLINYLLKKKVYVVFLYSENNDEASIFVSEELQIINPFFLSATYLIENQTPLIELFECKLLFSKVITSIFSNDLYYYGPQIGYNRVGIELIKDNCWKCKNEIFSVTGIVIPNKKVNNWKLEDWNYFHTNLNLKDLPIDLTKMIKDKVEYYKLNYKQNVTSIMNNYSNTMKLKYPSATCPYCNKMRGDFYLNEKRMDFMHNLGDNINKNNLIYIGLDCKLEQKTLNKLNNGFISNTEVIGWYLNKNILQQCI